MSVAFHDLPADQFPFEIVFTRADTGEEVQRIRVEGPGVVEVPALGRALGVKINVRIEGAQ